MKLFFLCAFIAIPGLVRSVDVHCVNDNSAECTVSELVTIKTGEKVNIVSGVNLNSVNKIVLYVSMVPKEIFEQLPNLTHLELYATVKALNEGDFEKATNLKNLTISDQLKTIPAGVLGSARNLERLTLRNNEIAEIEDNAFNGLNALLYINLNYNKLTIIKQNTFNGLEKLEALDLVSNQIESIEENALNLPNLKKFSVFDNKLTSLPDNLFSATPLLEVITANRNQIIHAGKSLYGLKKLNVLSLSYNNLTDVDLMAFAQMPLLGFLILHENSLTSEIFRKIEIKEPSKSMLTWLTLYGNELTDKDDWKKLAIFPQLKTIEVQNNKYSKIDLGDKTLRQQFPNLIKVYISSGEWSCDWLKNFVESSEKDGINIIELDSTDTNGKEINGIGCV